MLLTKALSDVNEVEDCWNSWK